MVGGGRAGFSLPTYALSYISYPPSPTTFGGIGWERKGGRKEGLILSCCSLSPPLISLMLHPENSPSGGNPGFPYVFHGGAITPELFSPGEETSLQKRSKHAANLFSFFAHESI